MEETDVRGGDSISQMDRQSHMTGNENNYADVKRIKNQ